MWAPYPSNYPCSQQVSLPAGLVLAQVCAPELQKCNLSSSQIRVSNLHKILQFHGGFPLKKQGSDWCVAVPFELQGGCTSPRCKPGCTLGVSMGFMGPLLRGLESGSMCSLIAHWNIFRKCNPEGLCSSTKLYLTLYIYTCMLWIRLWQLTRLQSLLAWACLCVLRHTASSAECFPPRSIHSDDVLIRSQKIKDIETGLSAHQQSPVCNGCILA